MVYSVFHDLTSFTIKITLQGSNLNFEKSNQIIWYCNGGFCCNGALLTPLKCMMMAAKWAEILQIATSNPELCLYATLFHQNVIHHRMKNAQHCDISTRWRPLAINVSILQSHRYCPRLPKNCGRPTCTLFSGKLSFEVVFSIMAMPRHFISKPPQLRYGFAHKCIDKIGKCCAK